MSYQEIGIHHAADIRLARRLGGMRVCFLFNHDQIHQIAHSLPTARLTRVRGNARRIWAAANVATLIEFSTMGRANRTALSNAGSISRHRPGGLAELLSR